MSNGYYADFLRHFKGRGYVFWDFAEYMAADKGGLPDKLMVIRHDIHYRDLANAYRTLEVEREVLGRTSSTNYVMWGLDGYLPEEKALEHDQRAVSAYEAFIGACIGRGVDVQPHISPLDMYLADLGAWWEGESVEALSDIFKLNYVHAVDDVGGKLEVTGHDVLGLEVLNCRLPALIGRYVEKWMDRFGKKIQGVSAHGSSHINMNRVFGNGIILNQRFLLESGLYGYDTYNTAIRKHLAYLSDNSRPYWMFEPGRIQDGRYQLLHHPHLWTDDAIGEAAKKKLNAHGYSAYPYLAQQEVVSDLTGYLNYDGDIDGYNRRFKGCII